LFLGPSALYAPAKCEVSKTGDKRGGEKTKGKGAKEGGGKGKGWGAEERRGKKMERKMLSTPIENS